MLTLFSWFSGLAVASLLTLHVLSPIGILRYLRRENERLSIWQSTIAHAAAAVGFGVFVFLVTSNFTELIGGSVQVAAILLVAVPVVFYIGAFTVRLQAGHHKRDS